MSEPAIPSILSCSSPSAEAVILPRLARMAREAAAPGPGPSGCEGLLFHGTCEPISGDLRPGAYDGVFWTARTPAVAQAYIPSAGVKRILSIPGPSEMADRLRPTEPGDPIMSWALSRCGAVWQDLDVDIARGRPASWRVLSNWPSRGDLRSWISEDLGYGLPDRGYWEVSCARDASGREVIMPASWRMPGQLFILHVPDLAVIHPTWSEDQVMLKPHNRTADFRRMSEAGIEAFAMSDLLQSDVLGNVAHVSVGLLPAALARADWISIPARRHDGDDPSIFRQSMTPDLAAFLEAFPASSSTFEDLDPETPGP